MEQAWPARPEDASRDVTRLDRTPLSLERLDERGMRQALRLVAKREHTLLSLAELSQELTISLDLYHLADLVLFNLMGQVGTSRSALWLKSESGTPVLVRSHGVNRQLAKALGASCSVALMDHLGRAMEPAQSIELESVVGNSAAKLIQRADVSIFAPIAARDEVLGLLALGRRIGGDLYGTVELQALQTSLGMVGVSIQNMIFYNRLLENNRQLRMANNNLKSLDKLKSEFMSNVNHELRTPLTNIIAYVDCVLDQKLANEGQLEFLKIVMEEAIKLQGLLENLLAFSAIAQEKLPISATTADVVATLHPYHQDRLPGVSEKLRELAFESEPGLPPAHFDEERVLQIVDALVDNAVKFTPEGARILLRVRRVATDAGLVAIDVEDDGPGIPADRLPELFDSFRQGDGSSTRQIGGMGVGLALARQLAQRMNGDLVVTSQIGRGSTFTLTLPTADRRKIEANA